MPREYFAQRTRILFAAEGASERSYGTWLHKLAEERGLNLHIDSWLCGTGGGDLLSLARRAQNRIREQARLRRSYNIRCLLLDKDKLGDNPDRDQQGFAIARERRIRIIWQEWDHEAFLLRHLPGCATLRPSSGQSERALKRRWPEYRKNMAAQDIGKKLDANAVGRAARIEPDLRDFLVSVGWPLADQQ